MGLFSIFKKQTPDEIYQIISGKIVHVALAYRLKFEASNNKISADVGAEVVYLLLHYLDRQVFSLLGASGRNQTWDEIVKKTINDYARAIFTSSAPQDLLNQHIAQMFCTLDSRQTSYGLCGKLLGNPFPEAGTMVFAFSFFVHRALEITDRENIDDILSAKHASMDDLRDFPDIGDMMKASVEIGSMVSKIRIEDDLKQLKRN